MHLAKHLCGKPLSPLRPLFAKILSTLPLELLTGWGQAESFAADHSTSTLPLRPIYWALLPLQFTAQGGVNGDMLQHLSHRWVVCTAQTAWPSIKEGPLRTAECQVPLPAHLHQPFHWSPAEGGSCLLLHWPSEQVPTRLADGARVAYDTLPAMKRETCLLSASEKIHSNFLS